ncbi:hypothetical protein WJX82_008165 [Trebouxia sp. C0006]
MVAIQVYKISTAKNDKLPKHSEIVQEQEINPNGFAYARDMPKDEQNCTWYVVGEDEHLMLLTIEDLVVEKDGTMLYLPESLSKPTLQFKDLKALESEPGAVKIKALAILPPPTQVNPL